MGNNKYNIFVNSFICQKCNMCVAIFNMLFIYHITSVYLFKLYTLYRSTGVTQTELYLPCRSTSNQLPDLILEHVLSCRHLVICWCLLEKNWLLIWLLPEPCLTTGITRRALQSPMESWQWVSRGTCDIHV